MTGLYLPIRRRRVDMSEEKIFNIGVMIGTFHTQHVSELVAGIREASKTENVNVSFFVGAQGNALDFCKGDENDFNAYNYQYNTLYDYSLVAGFDAIIISYGTLCIYLENENREEFVRKFRSVPLMILEEYDEDSPDSFIISDNYGSMYSIVDHLLSDHGYKKILYLSGPKNNTDAKERESAYREAMKARNIDVTGQMVEYGDYTSNVDRLVERLLDNNPDAEAIVSANDEMTTSIYRVCRSRGIKPGKDIAVTGYDDVEYAKRMDPPLTTANQDGFDMGYRALKCAVSLCKDPKPIKMKIPAKFIKRQSCGCKVENGDKELELVDFLEKIDGSKDIEQIKEVVAVAAADSYQRTSTEETRENGEAYFEYLITLLLKLREHTEFDEKEISESVFGQIQNLCVTDGLNGLDLSRFMRAFHQVIKYFMEKEKNSEVLLMHCRILEVTDTYVNSFTIRNNEENMSMFLEKSWAAPASIKYMIDKVEDENAFNRMALETAINQGAKCAYLYLLPEPLKCNRNEEFKCPDKLELACEYVDGEVKAFEKGERPVIDKNNGFASLFSKSSKYNYGVFLLFAKDYQYGIMICEVDSVAIGTLYGVTLQISTAKAYMQVSEQEREAKKQLCDTLEEIKKKNEVLSFVSTTDVLTGLFNRRGFIERVINEINDHIGKKAALFYHDLDHLKQINDQFGHSDGDFAITNAAKIIKETMENYRSEGVCCGRVGGDEFVSFMIIDDDSDIDKLLVLFKEGYKKFNETCDKPYYIEFSTGSTTFICKEVFSIVELTSQADENLYEAKKTRRENIVK